uniref:hypothetical protein n=1 Tax=Bifidobacterium adolescentis TaxID=1680 RepID=UPI00359C1AFF
MASFTDEQMRLLKGNDAISEVSRTRIYYREWFQMQAIMKNRLGMGPTRIFTEAGLPPSLVGYKRIERCMSRWRRKYEDLDLTELDVRGTSLKRRGRTIVKTELAGGLRELRASLDELKDLMAGLRSDLESMEAAINEKGGRA